MRIKKKYDNNYLLTEEGMWVRDFTQRTPKIDINNLCNERDIRLFLKNELSNVHKINSTLEERNIIYPNLIIVSDGYDFEEQQEKLAEFSYKDVKIISTNGTLAKWKMVGEKASKKRAISFYVANNPFEECARYLPKKHRYFPDCVASTRTNPLFTRNYDGSLFFYTPTLDQKYSPQIKAETILDDYRNPICAAIHLAYTLGVQKLLLFCCDDSFKEERATAENLDNGLWTYPQQIMSQHVIDACLYWLKTQGVKIGNCSKGIKLEHANYISLENITDFFLEE